LGDGEEGLRFERRVVRFEMRGVYDVYHKELKEENGVSSMGNPRLRDRENVMP
jgi:hypothetical protein